MIDYEPEKDCAERTIWTSYHLDRVDMKRKVLDGNPKTETQFRRLYEISDITMNVRNSLSDFKY